MLAQTTEALTRGTPAVQSIVADTTTLSPLMDAVRSTDNVFTNLGSIQTIHNLQPPDCDPEDGPRSQHSNTICWVFTDGRP